MVMALVLQNTHPLHCLMHFSVLFGFTQSMIAGPIWSHERWHTIPVGQPALLHIASCIRGYYNSHLSEGATSTYRDETEIAWARSWPIENIWKLRKED